MMVRKWRWAVVLGVVAVLADRAVAAKPAEPPEAARWVAEDAVIYLELSDPNALIDRLADERVRGPLTAIPSVKALLNGEQYGKLMAAAGLVSAKLGTTPEIALRKLTGGGIVFAVEEVKGAKPRAVLVVTPTDPELLRKASAALIDLARQDAEGKGMPDPVKSADYRGVTGYAVGDGAYVVLKDRLVIVDRPDSAKVIIDRALDGLKTSMAAGEGWKDCRAGLKPDALAWGAARMDRLRALDPKHFKGSDAKKNAGEFLLFGGWLETLRQDASGPRVAVLDRRRLGAELVASLPADANEAIPGVRPRNGSGAPSLISPPGTIATVGLWRDLAALWEARAALLAPEDVQNLNKLDTFAGQFFGGRDFGSGVLGALAGKWRLVVALQDETGLNPSPDVKLPAFALVLDLKPGDDDFAQRLRVAFQSFVGLSNLNAAQTKAPPLELGSEVFEGVTISTTKFVTPKPGPSTSPKGPVHTRHNFSPSAAQVGDHFILGSSLGLTRGLVTSLKSPAAESEGSGTLSAEADGLTLSRLVEQNRARLVMQNMLEKGHDKDQAEGEIGFLSSLLRYLGHGRLSVRDDSDATRVGLEFRLGR